MGNITKQETAEESRQEMKGPGFESRITKYQDVTETLTNKDAVFLREPPTIPSLMSHFTNNNESGFLSGTPTLLPPLSSVSTSSNGYIPVGTSGLSLVSSNRLNGIGPMLPPLLEESGPLDLFGELGSSNLNFNDNPSSESALLGAASLPFFSHVAGAGGSQMTATTNGSSEDEDEDDDALRNFLNSLSADQLIQLGKNVASVQKQKLNPQQHGHDMFKPYNSASGSTSRTPNSKLTPTRAPVLHQGTGGIQYIRFQYPNKGQHQEYSIRADIDHIEAEQLPEDFKRENCVYPRAYCIFENYVGNRYEYETQVNDIAWRLTWLNRDILSGKRGLIQRAVDNYRNLFRESRSRRVIRQDKITTGTLRRRSGEFPLGEPLAGSFNNTLNSPSAPPYSHTPSSGTSSYASNNPYKNLTNALANSSINTGNSDMMTAMIQYEDRRGKIVQTKIRLNVDLVDTSMLMDEKFKLNNCLFPHAYHQALQYYNSATPQTGDMNYMFCFDSNHFSF